MPKAIAIYECKFCGLRDENEKIMHVHEKLCVKDPENMCCDTCGRPDNCKETNIICCKQWKPEVRKRTSIFTGFRLA